MCWGWWWGEGSPYLWPFRNSPLPHAPAAMLPSPSLWHPGLQGVKSKPQTLNAQPCCRFNHTCLTFCSSFSTFRSLAALWWKWGTPTLCTRKGSKWMTCHCHMTPCRGNQNCLLASGVHIWVLNGFLTCSLWSILANGWLWSAGVDILVFGHFTSLCLFSHHLGFIIPAWTF